MKLRWRICVVLLALAAAVVFVARWLLRPDTKAQAQVEETRRDLRRQGYKLDLSEFELSLSPEQRSRAAVLTKAGDTLRSFSQDYFSRATRGTNGALVVWKQKKLNLQSDTSSPDSDRDFSVNTWKAPSSLTEAQEVDAWRELRNHLERNQSNLESAREILLTGWIEFEPQRQGALMLLPHLGPLRRLATSLSAALILDLHDGNNEAAWADLLALTRLTTAWKAEPSEISRLVRFTCADVAFNTTWQALQADFWSERQLSLLQQEWEATDLLGGLPDTAAFSRASTTALCRFDRTQPNTTIPVGAIPRLFLNELISSPADAIPNFLHSMRSISRERRYLRSGTYEDETALLLHFCDRENDLKQAIKCANWTDMCRTPAFTNEAPFTSRHISRMQSLMNLQQIGRSFQNPRRPLIARAVEAETKRRILITAMALSRHRQATGGYPPSLDELAPRFLAEPLRDFIDDKPLHYFVKDGTFTLYSVGLDGIDDGGLPAVRQRFSNELNKEVRADLVWPRAIEPTW